MQVEKFMASFWRVVKESFYIAKLNNDQYKNYAWPAEVRRKLTTSMRNSPKICQLTDSKRKATTKRGPSKIVWLTMNGASNISIAVPLSFTTTRHLLNQVLNRTTVTQSHWTSNNHYTNCPAPLFIRNAFCTPGFFTVSTFYTRQLTHQPFQTKQPLPQAALTRDTIYTRHLLHRTTYTFYTTQLLHLKLFTASNFYIKHLLHQILYTKHLFSPSTLHNRHPLHETTFTPRTFYTKTTFTKQFLHNSTFYRPLKPQQLLLQTPFTP